MAFECTVERQGDTVVVTPEGDVDLESATYLREVLRRMVADKQDGRIDVDMHAVTFLDSSGLGMLVAARRAAEVKGITLRLREPGPMVRMVLEVANLDSLLIAAPADPHAAG
jgi:anti-anti-sigma factor